MENKVNIELNAPPYWYNNGQGIDEALYDIYKKYKVLEAENNRLKKENTSLKSEQYKDAELSKLAKKIDDLEGDLTRGFGISQDEQNKITEWCKSHDCKYSNNKLKGIASYRFAIIPGIGYNGYVTCSCGKEYCFCEE